MKVKIQLAESPQQILEAQNLVRKVYQKCFNLDLNHLKKYKNHNFSNEVLIAISPDSNEIIGTLSFMYPNKGIYPCESSFGFDLKASLIGKEDYVEIGRFATSDESKQHLTVVISLFLGIAAYLEKKQLHGWVATVKDHIFNFFTKIELPMNCINQSPNISKKSPIWWYIQDHKTLHLFNISSEVSIRVFKNKFQKYIDNGSIEINL